MKYSKGSFITVPSKHLLEGLNPISQCLYMWLCAYANETGECFPSRKTLAVKVGCSLNTIDNMLALLINRGLVIKENRFKKSEQTTNLYSVQVVGGTPTGGVPTPRGGVPLPQEVGTELNPLLTQSKNYNAAQGAGDEIALFIYLFRGVNPSLGRLYGRKPQREASQRLLKLHPLEWWERFMEAYAVKFPDRFCPKATTPVQLEEKLGQIIGYAESAKREAIKNINQVIV